MDEHNIKKTMKTMEALKEVRPKVVVTSFSVDSEENSKSNVEKTKRGERQKIKQITRKELISFLKGNLSSIPDTHKLIHKLNQKKPNDGDLVHAWLIERIYYSNQFEITGVELTGTNYDVDIELDNKINIQVWYGASYGSHRLLEINDIKVKSFSGGIKTNLEGDIE
ncbi:MAG: hypothetical protein KJ655_03670, partial [Candidatus Thermoplasmatota archaeon]|nr:hypothetical protein [Candidatus Thermoplasmatota archaeon]